VSNRLDKVHVFRSFCNGKAIVNLKS